MTWSHTQLRVKEGMSGFARTIMEMCRVSKLKVIVSLLPAFTIWTQVMLLITTCLLLVKKSCVNSMIFFLAAGFGSLGLMTSVLVG